MYAFADGGTELFCGDLEGGRPKGEDTGFCGLRIAGLVSGMRC